MHKNTHKQTNYLTGLHRLEEESCSAATVNEGGLSSHVESKQEPSSREESQTPDWDEAAAAGTGGT